MDDVTIPPNSIFEYLLTRSNFYRSGEGRGRSALADNGIADRYWKERFALIEFEEGCVKDRQLMFGACSFSDQQGS